MRAVAKAVGVSEGTVRNGLRQGRLHRASAPDAPRASKGAPPEPTAPTPARRSAEEHIVALEQQRKTLIDLIKMVAYETAACQEV